MSDNNSSNAIPDIDGLKIINRLSGWRMEFDVLCDYLFGPSIERCRVFKKVFFKYQFCKNEDEALEFADRYQLKIQEKIGTVQHDEDGNAKPADFPFNPTKCSLIKYLMSRTVLHNFYIDEFLRKNNKEKSESDFVTVTSEDGKQMTLLMTTKDVHYDEAVQQENYRQIIDNFVISPFLEYCDVELKTELPSEKKLPEILNYHIMAVFQLYPQIFGCEAYVKDESQYDQDEFGWFHCHDPYKYDTDGLERAIDETFEKSKTKNPDDPPEKVLYECHTLSGRYELLQSTTNTLRKKLACIFAPISKSEALERLAFTAKSKKDYVDFVEAWYGDNLPEIQRDIKIYNPYFHI